MTTDPQANDPKYNIVWPGSMPAGMDWVEASRLLYTGLGSLMDYFPPQEAPDWIVPFLMRLRDHPDLEVTREGQWKDYKDQIRYRIKPGHVFREEFINVGIVDSVAEGLPVFYQLRRELNLPADGAFQVSTKGVLDFAFFAFGAKGILQQSRHLVPFLDATTREMAAAYKRAGTSTPLLFQLEVPAETVFACKLDVAATAWMARHIVRLAAHVPQGARCGIHLCYGDLGHKALVKPRTLAPLAGLVNQIIAKWPAGHPAPAYIHIPMASGENPPTAEKRYYAPLERLTLPEGTQLVAGLLHEGLSQLGATTIAEWVDEAVPGRLALAPSCGCGRRTQQQAEAVIRQGAALCTSGGVASASASASSDSD